MSYGDLVESYKSGRISRRSFVKGMTALGLSATAATRLADQIGAAPAPKGRVAGRAVGDDTYDDVYDDGKKDDTEYPDTGVGAAATGISLKVAALGGAALAAGAAIVRKREGSSEA